MVDGLPRREVAREQAPGAAAPQDVEDRIEDSARRVGLGSTAGLLRRQKGVQAEPFGVGEIGRVCTHAPERMLPVPWRATFQTVSPRCWCIIRSGRSCRTWSAKGAYCLRQVLSRQVWIVGDGPKGWRS